jgi:uncharacterized membrane protein
MSIVAPPAPPAEPARAGSPGPRLLAVDALRGIAVLLMIEQHLGAWLWKVPAGHKVWDFPRAGRRQRAGRRRRAAFITVAGVGAALFVAGARPPRPRDAPPRAHRHGLRAAAQSAGAELV